MKAFVLVALVFLAYGLVSSHYIVPWTKVTLTHHWPQTFCIMEHCKQNYKYWTLHGLWPNSGMNCNNTWKFNISEVQDLRQDMEQFWPNLLHPSSTEFWKYEWHKHGTCAASVESLDSQHKYFSKALELYKLYDLTGILAKAGIVPGEQNYRLEDIENAIVKAYGGQPKIQCLSPSAKGEQTQQLGQIEICLNRDFKPIDCEKSVDDLRHRVNDTLFFYRLKGLSGFHVCDVDMPVQYPLLTGTF